MTPSVQSLGPGPSKLAKGGSSFLSRCQLGKRQQVVSSSLQTHAGYGRPCGGNSFEARSIAGACQKHYLDLLLELASAVQLCAFYAAILRAYRHCTQCQRFTGMCLSHSLTMRLTFQYFGGKAVRSSITYCTIPASAFS